MKKQVTVQLTVMLDMEIDIDKEQSLEDEVHSVIANLDYEFKEFGDEEGRVFHTEIIEDEIVLTTDIGE